MEKEFYQKNGYAVRMISRDLLLLNDGDRIPAMDEYTGRFEVSRWVIQQAQKFLEGSGCVRYEKRGVLGTFVYFLDRKKLWDYAGLDPVYGLAPLPSSILQESLLTGLTEEFKAQEVPLIMTFLPSSGARFDCMAKGQCHFVVTTKMAARLAVETYPDMEIAAVIPDAQYCEPYCLLPTDKTKKGVWPGCTIGVHEGSIEQNYIASLIEEKTDITIVKVNYHDQMEMYRTGGFDFYLSRGDRDLLDSVGATVSIPITDLGIDESLFAPAIVVRKGTCNMATIINKYFDIGKIGAIQKEVLSGKRSVRYI